MKIVGEVFALLILLVGLEARGIGKLSDNDEPWTYVQDDIRVAIEEVAVVLLGPFLDGELLDPPDLHTRLLSCKLPGSLLVPCMLAHLLLELHKLRVDTKPFCSACDTYV